MAQLVTVPEASFVSIKKNAFGLTLGDEDLYPSIRDDEERVPEIALLKKRLSLAITVLDEHVADSLELRFRKVLEDIDSMEDVHHVLGRH